MEIFLGTRCTAVYITTQMTWGRCQWGRWGTTPTTKDMHPTKLDRKQPSNSNWYGQKRGTSKI